jgi:hypothetical protein
VLHTPGEQKGREERGGTDDNRVPLNGAAGGLAGGGRHAVGKG